MFGDELGPVLRCGVCNGELTIEYGDVGKVVMCPCGRAHGIRLNEGHIELGPVRDANEAGYKAMTGEGAE